MKNIFFLLALFLCPKFCLAEDYDSFILHFLRVIPKLTDIQVQASFAAPKNTAEQTLLDGTTLLLSVEFEVSKDRILFPSKNIAEHKELWLLRYDPLARQFVASQNRKTLLQSTDADLLLRLLISDVQVKIPVELETEEEYELEIEVSLRMNPDQKGLSKFSLASSYILSPSKFETIFIVPVR